jgi:hypothetical protein
MKKFLIRSFTSADIAESFVEMNSANYDLMSVNTTNENIVVTMKRKSELENMELKLKALEMKQNFEPYLTSKEIEMLDKIIKD